MTAERPADVAALTGAERESLNAATGWPPKNTNLFNVVTFIVAARVAAARAESYEAGRAEVTAAVEVLADEWAAMGTVSVYESAGELAQLLRAALAAAPTLATVRDDAGRDAT